MFKLLNTIVTLSLLTGLARADVNSTTTTISQIYTYTAAGNGDMLLVPKDVLPACDGFWLDNEAPGFEINVSVALSAYHAGSPVMLYGNETELFSGSSNKFCKLTVLRLMPK